VFADGIRSRSDEVVGVELEEALVRSTDSDEDAFLHGFRSFCFHRFYIWLQYDTAANLQKTETSPVSQNSLRR